MESPALRFTSAMGMAGMRCASRSEGVPHTVVAMRSLSRSAGFTNTAPTAPSCWRRQASSGPGVPVTRAIAPRRRLSSCARDIAGVVAARSTRFVPGVGSTSRTMDAPVAAKPRRSPVAGSIVGSTLASPMSTSGASRPDEVGEKATVRLCGASSTVPSARSSSTFAEIGSLA